MTHRAYKFRIYPTKSQIILLNKTFGCVRFLYNKHVAAFNSYGVYGPVQQITSKLLKDNSNFAFLNDVSASALQQKDRDFDVFKKQFFNASRKKSLGRPKFKKNDGTGSYRLTNQRFDLCSAESKIRLEKIGKVNVVLDREIPRTARYINVTVSKNKLNEFYASILVDEPIEHKPTTGRSVGIDLGLIDLLTLSNGLVIGNPKFFRENQAKLAKAQRKLGKKTKGSKRYERQRLRVARLHKLVARQRGWYLHQISSYLVEHYDTIVMEDLNIAGMKKLFGKSVSDAGWTILVGQIAYKSNWYGRTFHKVSRFFASSKTCSHCGEKTKFGLDVREWICSHCYTHHDRDLNAAINILTKGLQDLYDYTSEESSEVIGRGEDVRPPLDAMHPMVATSLKRLADFYKFA